jgi:predicted amidophosphoribosyltransferase
LKAAKKEKMEAEKKKKEDEERTKREKEMQLAMELEMQKVRICGFCLQDIPFEARRCMYCTSHLEAANENTPHHVVKRSSTASMRSQF